MERQDAVQTGSEPAGAHSAQIDTDPWPPPQEIKHHLGREDEHLVIENLPAVGLRPGASIGCSLITSHSRVVMNKRDFSSDKQLLRKIEGHFVAINLCANNPEDCANKQKAYEERLSLSPFPVSRLKTSTAAPHYYRSHLSMPS